MIRVESTEGIMDVVSMMNEHDTLALLPTLGHAIEWWRIYRTAVTEMHGGALYVVHTKTAVTSRRTRTTLRLWVPYAPSPEMPMGFKVLRQDFDLVSPYYTKREMKWMIS